MKLWTFSWYLVDAMKNVNYNSWLCPIDYRCAVCSKHGVKLWREYQTINPELCCADCAAKSQGKDISDIGSDGTYTTDYGMTTDQIGWRVPAVPDEEGIGYWGYTSVPQSGLNWWKRLPTR
jgi:hypothetical protein